MCSRFFSLSLFGVGANMIGAWFCDCSTDSVVDVRASSVEGVFLALVDKLGVDLDEDYDQLRGIVFECGQKLARDGIGMVVDVFDMDFEEFKLILMNV